MGKEFDHYYSVSQLAINLTYLLGDQKLFFSSECPKAVNHLLHPCGIEYIQKMQIKPSEAERPNLLDFNGGSVRDATVARVHGPAVNLT